MGAAFIAVLNNEMTMKRRIRLGRGGPVNRHRECDVPAEGGRDAGVLM
jgi:hypothetical protein